MSDKNSDYPVNKSSDKRKVAEERLDAKKEKDYEKNKLTLSNRNTKNK